MFVLKRLIENELKSANKKFPPFSSRHEAYSVLREEYEEFMEEINKIGKGVLKDYWELCKNHKLNTQKDKKYPCSIYGDEECKQLLDSLEDTIINSFNELLQLGAMIQKAKNLEEEEK